jgi:hypothetical protein
MLEQKVIQSLNVASADDDRRTMFAELTERPHRIWKVCELERNNVLFEPGQAAGSLPLERVGVCAMGFGVATAAEDDAGVEAVVAAALVVAAADVFVTIPVAEEVPDVVVAVAVAAIVELLDAVIVIRLEVEDGKLDEVDDVGAAGAGSFSFLSPNISPNPIPNASARIIKTANTSRR